jgi:predicted dehydrogenase
VFEFQSFPFNLFSHMPQHLSRRSFVKSVGLTGVGVWAATSGAARAISPNEKLNIAIVGLGRQGTLNIKSMMKENIVAITDADHGYMMQKAGEQIEKFPNARLFEDFRIMFDKMDKQIDAVVVSTPDHLHFHPAWSAMQRGKHLYQEKPLAHNVWEVRQLTNLAREKKVATQLGVQRHTNKGLRNGVELVRSGVLGPIKEVYSWVPGGRGGDWTKITEPSTDKLNWDMWLGPTEKIPHRNGLAHYDFRFWWKYGTGEAGNFGCHILDIPFWALDLKYPSKVSGKGGPTPDPERTPKEMGTTFEFAATDKRPAVTLHWNHGRPEKVTRLMKEHGIENEKKPKDINNLFISEKGMLFCGYEEHSPYILLPEKDFEKVKPTGKMFEKSPGFRQEWIDACKGSKTVPTCNFEYSGPLTETVLLANVAYRTQTSFNWNGEKMEADKPEVTKLLKEAYRKGWEV